MKFLFCAIVSGQISLAVQKAVLSIRKYGHHACGLRGFHSSCVHHPAVPFGV